MKLNEDYLKQISGTLDGLSSSKEFHYIDLHGTVWLNPYFKQRLLTDVNIIEFTKMYPHIIVGLYDEGLLQGKQYSDHIERIRSFLTIDRTTCDRGWYSNEQAYVNSFYGNMYRFNRSDADLVTDYQHLLWNDIMSMNNQSDIMYIDTDIVLFQNNLLEDKSSRVPLTLPEIILPFTRKIYDYLYIEKQKHYVYLDSEDRKIRYYGFRPHIDKSNNKLNEIVSIIKSEQRNNKIELILQ